MAGQGGTGGRGKGAGKRRPIFLKFLDPPLVLVDVIREDCDVETELSDVCCLSVLL